MTNTKKEYKATITYTKGWGAEKVECRTNNYKELVDKVEKFVNKYNGKTVTMLNVTSTYKVKQVVYNYPSGKSYTQKYM